VVVGSSRARSVQRFALCMLMVLATAQAALAVPNFTPQQRVGYTTGDQWEPAMAAATSIFCFHNMARSVTARPALRLRWR